MCDRRWRSVGDVEISALRPRYPEVLFQDDNKESVERAGNGGFNLRYLPHIGTDNQQAAPTVSRVPGP